MNRALWILAAVFVAALLIGSDGVFTVSQTQSVLITEIGKPKHLITDPGLHIKLPFVETAIFFDNRLLDYEAPSEEVILGDQRRLIVDSFTRYRIVDPLQYYQAVGATEEGIRDRLTSVVTSSLRRVLGNETLIDVLSVQRSRIMGEIRTQVNNEMRGFGVDIVDVRIRRADLPAENTEAILQRMQSERQRVAAQARAEGAESSAKIRANADREKTVLLAQARADAETLRGEGEAQATATYAAAYQRDPQFYGVWRTLQAYKEVFGPNTKAKLMITPQNDFLKLLQGP